jgi:hypothetical protein
MTVKEFLASKQIEFEDGYFITETYPSKIYKWIEEYHQAKLKLLGIAVVVGRSEQLGCDVCGSTDVIEAPHMGRNCNRCHPL